ncbi:hypothetical protein GIB67_020668 [Kingdonia uniflora]|uniref:Uncharacterized protein n=1 Tax=Kingdonia uniflora TaxID=39325 RepID=A0A7J7N5C6_9MAGN|nr:hypothetical protein GIB67_020668 [Kingdonia uniflora]
MRFGTTTNYYIIANHYVTIHYIVSIHTDNNIEVTSLGMASSLADLEGKNLNYVKNEEAGLLLFQTLLLLVNSLVLRRNSGMKDSTKIVNRYDTRLYLATHKVYGGEARLLSKEKGDKIESKASLLAALDYYVSMQSGIFISS